jgi:hypothetical protein
MAKNTPNELEAIKNAFICGIARGRFDERSLTRPPTANTTIPQAEFISELKKVEAEYSLTWQDDLLMAGFPDVDGLVHGVQLKGWIKEQEGKTSEESNSVETGNEPQPR